MDVVVLSHVGEDVGPQFGLALSHQVAVRDVGSLQPTHGLLSGDAAMEPPVDEDAHTRVRWWSGGGRTHMGETVEWGRTHTHIGEMVEWVRTHTHGLDGGVGEDAHTWVRRWNGGGRTHT